MSEETLKTIATFYKFAEFPEYKEWKQTWDWGKERDSGTMILLTRELMQRFQAHGRELKTL